MPEMVDLVDSIPSWKCAHFNTCAYESNLEVGTRHYKPQMIGGTLPGIEDLCKRCPCGNRPHEPVVGKERSARSAAYPTEFCKAYATLAVNHFEKIAQAEFLEGRLKLLEDRIEHLRGKAYDFSQEAMDIEEYNKTVMESVEYKKGLEHKRKMAESKSPPGGESAAAGAGASASSGSSLVWKGGHGKHGALREPRNKEEVPKALVHVGGMRDPHKAVSKLPTVQSQGARLWSRWLTFAANNPKVTDVAESYGTERCAFNQDLVEKWKEHLCELWDIAVPGAKLVEKGKYATPVLHKILDAWIKKSGDPETEVPKWLASGTPLGIELPIKSVGIFPPAEEDDVGGPGDYVLSDAVLERPETMKNYKSVEEDVEGTNIELQRYEKHNFLKRISQDEAKKLYPDGTVSRLGLVTKQKEGGEVKRRVVIDLRRSGGNAKSKLPERLVLPRLTDAIKLFKDIRRRSNGLAEKSEVNVLEFALVDISDAFTVLPVAEEELKHTLTPSTAEGEVLVFQALLFGYKVAPLLYSRFAATVARLLQSAVRIEKGGHEVYLDDSLWALQGKLHDRNITLAFILNTMAALGLKVALHKGARSSSVVWIGVTLTLVDHNTLVVGLPEKFIQELQEILASWENKGYAACKELRVVAGKCAWLGGILPRARWTTSTFYAVLTQTQKEEADPREGAREHKGLFAVKRLELARVWLYKFLEAAKSRPMRKVSLLPERDTADLRIMTDASPEALGGVLAVNGRIIAAYFCHVEPKEAEELAVEFGSSSSQGTLEALAILVALRRWKDKVKGMAVSITVQSDSITALALSKKMAAKSGSPGLNFIGAELAVSLEELGVEELKTLHIPGRANREPDWLSRPSTWEKEPMPPGLEGIEIAPEPGPVAGFYRLPTPKAAPSLWGVKDGAAGGSAVWDAVCWLCLKRKNSAESAPEGQGIGEGRPGTPISSFSGRSRYVSYLSPPWHACCKILHQGRVGSKMGADPSDWLVLWLVVAGAGAHLAALAWLFRACWGSFVCKRRWTMTPPEKVSRVEAGRQWVSGQHSILLRSTSGDSRVTQGGS